MQRDYGIKIPLPESALYYILGNSETYAGGQMIKFPYVTEYVLFKRAEIAEAEELLREYNDFFIYNQSQYNDIFKRPSDDAIEGINDEDLNDEKLQEIKRLSAEQNAKAACDHFARLFGSKDFAEASMVGLKISWYDLQQILLEEFRAKTPVTDSAMNYISPALRNIASLLLFAERLHSGLEKMRKEPGDKTREHNEKVDAGLRRLEIWFNESLERLSAGTATSLPEFNKARNIIAKLKKPEDVLEFCENNLAIN